MEVVSSERTAVVEEHVFGRVCAVITEYVSIDWPLYNQKHKEDPNCT